MPRITSSPNFGVYRTVGQAAEFLGVSRATLRNWDRAGKLKPRRHPQNGYRIYLHEDLEAILRSADLSRLTDASFAPQVDWREMGESEHFVQFYENDEFLATLARDLCNSLAPIDNALELLRTCGANEKLAEEARSIIARQVKQMTRLVDDLLDLSRIARDKIDLRRDRVELAAIVKDAVETSRPLPPRCPRCGSTNVTLCGQSVECGPEERPGQPLEEREQHTFAYHCECGLGFTQTSADDARR